MTENQEQFLMDMVKEQLKTNQNISAVTLQLLESMGIVIQNQVRDMEQKVQSMDAIFKSIQQIAAPGDAEPHIPKELEAHTVSDPGTSYIYPVAFFVKDARKDEEGLLTDAFLYAMNNEHGVYYWVMDEEWNYVKNGFVKDIGISSDLELEIIKEKEFDFFCDLTMLDSSFVKDMILKHCDPQRFVGETAYELLRKSMSIAEEKDDIAMSKEAGDPEQKLGTDNQEQLKEIEEKKISGEPDIPKESEKNSRKKGTRKVH